MSTVEQIAVFISWYPLGAYYRRSPFRSGQIREMSGRCGDL